MLVRLITILYFRFLMGCFFQLPARRVYIYIYFNRQWKITREYGQSNESVRPPYKYVFSTRQDVRRTRRELCIIRSVVGETGRSNRLSSLS